MNFRFAPSRTVGGAEAHVREVLALRARSSGAALLAGGFTRSVAIAQWLQQGRMAEVRPEPLRARVAGLLALG